MFRARYRSSSILLNAAAAATPQPNAAPVNENDATNARKYARSAKSFAYRGRVLTQKYTGDHAKQYVTPWERVYYNAFRVVFTGHTLIGKDRWGNRFFKKYNSVKKRGEDRHCYRADASLQHQPYGALPIDDRLWEAWMRGWRAEPPTPEESENFRNQRTRGLGVYTMGKEESEDSIMRGLAHTANGASLMHELDPNQESNRALANNEDRQKNANPEAPWTMGFARGDLLYNEEQVEALRGNLETMFRDKQWAHLEMLRHSREKQKDYNVGKPKLNDDDPEMEAPRTQDYERPDRTIPFIEGCPHLKTPELEKLKCEVESLEEERWRVRKELGLSDLSDLREGRSPADPGPAPFAPEPTGKNWKPKCWGESWGIGGGRMV